MLKEYIFEDEIIVDFCKVTRDHNPIHNPQFMKEKGKKTVVPGMLLLSTAISQASELFQQGINFMELYFHNMIGTGEKAEIGYEILQRVPLKAEIIARNGINTLSKAGNSSLLMQLDSIPDFPWIGIERTLPVEPGQMQHFADLTGLKGKDLGNLLFAVSYASKALLLAVDEPVSEIEKEINFYLDKTKNPDQLSAFYQFLKIYLPNNQNFPASDKDLTYLIHFERVKLGRTYNAQVLCTQKGNLAYASQYQLIAIPERLIMRMVSNR